jgi:hypothetical protein
MPNDSTLLKFSFPTAEPLIDDVESKANKKPDKPNRRQNGANPLPTVQFNPLRRARIFQLSRKTHKLESSSPDQ